jgi:hypothetical protein
MTVPGTGSLLLLYCAISFQDSFHVSGDMRLFDYFDSKLASPKKNDHQQWVNDDIPKNRNVLSVISRGVCQLPPLVKMEGKILYP